MNGILLKSRLAANASKFAAMKLGKNTPTTK
jgi:hypothetical protein